jgi:hypothetical protein
MLTCMKAIATVPVDDGLNPDAVPTTADLIRDDEEYASIRVTMSGSLSIARLQFHIDINIGEPVSPAPGPVRPPRILGGELVVTGYPLAMVSPRRSTPCRNGAKPAPAGATSPGRKAAARAGHRQGANRAEAEPDMLPAVR